MRRRPSRRGIPAFVVLSIWASAGSAEEPTIAVTRLEKAPSIDGRIDPDEWAGAATIDQHLIQIEPEQGKPSPLRTVVRIAQTESALYVAFEAFDPLPSRIAAAETSRDGDLDDDDSVAVMLDTFLDQRTAYLFQTNTLSTQADGRIADNGRTFDEQWDAAWNSASRRLDDRWIAELEIPFTILRFRPGSDRSWGISVMRTVPRRLETSLWPAPKEDRFRVSNFGTVTGLELAVGAKKWNAIPYALGVIDEDGDTDMEIGGDFRWRPTSSTAVDLTLNPDFALVEADVEEINLSRFELFIPEKRPFFLEGSETFRQRIRQFYSRRIGDLRWGGKATGTLGKTGLSALVTSEDLASGQADSSGRAEYGVVRAQRSLTRGSTLGFLGANRRLGGEDQGSVGLDTTIFFTDTLGLTGQLLRVHGPTAEGGLAWFVRPAYDSNTTHFHVRYTHLDPNIRNDFNAVGFLRDDDRREWDTNLRRTFYLPGGAIEKIEAGANYNRFSSQENVLRSWELDTEIEVVFRNRWEIELEVLDEFKLFEKEFNNDRVELRVGWDGRKGRSLFGFAGEGTNFDSDLELYGLEGGWAVGESWRLSYSAARVELDPDPEGDTSWIHVFSALYSFQPDNFIKLFVQTNSAIDKTNVQAVWVWRFLPPFGSLQVAYQTGTSELGQTSEQGNTLFAKLAWVF